MVNYLYDLRSIEANHDSYFDQVRLRYLAMSRWLNLGERGPLKVARYDP